MNMSSNVSAQLKYANLQMAAEAILPAGFTGSVDRWANIVIEVSA